MIHRPAENESRFNFLLLPRVWQRAAEAVRTLHTWSLRGFLALLDQGLISGSNFVLAVLLARWLAPREYGVYALAFEVFLFLSVIYGSLILEPMSVFGPSTYRDDLRAYVGALLRIHCVLTVVMAAGVFATAAALNSLRPASSFPTVLVGVAVASPCLLLFWLARRAFYVLLMPQRAVWGACGYSAVMLAGVGIAYRFHFLSPFAAFMLMTGGAVLTGPAMLLWFRRRVSSSPVRRIATREVVRKHWNYGRWALASSVVIWFSAAVYYPLLGTFFNLAETGKFKALMNLSSPIGQAFFAVSLLSLPHASRTHHEGTENSRSRLTWRLTGLYVSGTCVYWFVLLALRSPVVHHLYGNRYPQITALLPWVALGSIFRIAATSQTIVLKAMHSPQMVFVAYAAACVVAVVVGVPCARWFGATGAVFVWGLSSAVAFVVSVLLVRRKSAQFRTSQAAASTALASSPVRALLFGG